MFPTGGTICNIISGDSTQVAGNKCTPDEWYMVVTAIGTCGHLLPAIRPEMTGAIAIDGDPIMNIGGGCTAIKDFIMDCMRPNLER